MLMPKRTKYRKMMKGRNRGYARSGYKIAFGNIAIKPLTKRPLEVRMGKGKGPIDQYVMNIKPGRIIFEMAGVNEELARKALTLAMHKLPFKTKIITAEMSNEIF